MIIQHTEPYNNMIVCRGLLTFFTEINGSVKPIIISKTEIEETGEKYIGFLSRKIKNKIKGIASAGDKILLLPEQISPEFLELIAKGEIKDGDECIIQCENHGECKQCQAAGIWHCAHADSCGNSVIFQQIKLSSNKANVFIEEKKEVKPKFKEQSFGDHLKAMMPALGLGDKTESWD